MSGEKRHQLVVRQEVRIVNELGLHARPAAEFVRAANIFRSEIWLVKREQRFSATSIVEVLTADLCCGDIAIIEADGSDSEQAVARLVEVVRGLSD
jgi:phosphocarrier protein HPr